MKFVEKLRRLSSEVQALKTVRPRAGSQTTAYVREIDIRLTIKGRNDATDGDPAYRHYSQAVDQVLVYFPNAKWGDAETMFTIAVGDTYGRIFDIYVSGYEDADDFANSAMGVMAYCVRGNSTDEAELAGDQTKTKSVTVKILLSSTSDLGEARIERYER